MSSTPPAVDTNQALVAIGERLRQARQARGLSLADLAAGLHMGQEQLRAIETADVSCLPEPVFVIAQIRRVADRLGVNADAEILELRGSDGLQRPTPTPPPEHDRADGQALPGSDLPSLVPSLGTGWLKLLMAVVLLPALGWLGLQAWERLQRPEAPRPPERASQPLGAQPGGATPPSQPAAPASLLQLSLSSAGTSWLEVRDSRGRTLFEGNFQGRRSFPLGQGLAVLAGRPDLVQAAIGDAAPRQLGPIEAVRWRRFSPPQP